MIIDNSLREFIAHTKYKIEYNGKRYPMLKVNDDNSYEFHPAIGTLTNKHVTCFINGVRMGKLVLVPHGDKICLMAIPGLNYHPMEVDYRLSVQDIRKFESFKLIVH